MNLVQGDCKCGALAFVAGENLSAATGLLVRLSSTGRAVKPEAVSDIALYVVAIGAFEGCLCGVVPLTSAANCRIVLKGACQAGSLLVSSGDGRVEAGALSGASVPVGVAEEAGVDGQRVLLRPLSVGARGEPGAAGPAGPAGMQGPAGAVGPSGRDGQDSDLFCLKSTGISQIGAVPALGWAGKCLALVLESEWSWTAARPASGATVIMVAVITGVLDPESAVPDFTVKPLFLPSQSNRILAVPRGTVGVPEGENLQLGCDVSVVGDVGGAMRLAKGSDYGFGSTMFRCSSIHEDCVGLFSYVSA